MKDAGGLSLSSLARLERRFGEALRHTPASRVNLRLAVRYILAELEAQNVPIETARHIVNFVAEHHPQRDDLDRVSKLTGTRESDRIVHQMMQWVDDLHGA